MTSEECNNTEGSFECVCKQGYFKNGQDKCIGIYINTCILGRTYFVERSIHLFEEHWPLIITGVQASGVIIDRFFSTVALNDQWLLLKPELLWLLIGIYLTIILWNRGE